MKNLSRRSFVAASSTFALMGLAGCASEPTDAGTDGGDGAAETEEVAGAIDKAAYDQLVASGPLASDEQIAASEWASAIKERGTLRVGGVQTSTLFSLLDETDNVARGFDAGLYQMLARYITGSQDNIEFVQVTSDTRESVLQNDQVDVVLATYTITDARDELIDFAGPYYTSRYSILVAAGNTDITGVDSLAGKNVAAQSGSTGPALVEEIAPEAIIQEFKTDEEARAALEQGRVDAYVYDDSMNRGSIIKNPGKYEVVGELFGPEDPYGIGLPNDNESAVSFCNEFLSTLIADGKWAELWKVAIGDRTGTDVAPEPPAITVE